MEKAAKSCYETFHLASKLLLHYLAKINIQLFIHISQTNLHVRLLLFFMIIN